MTVRLGPLDTTPVTTGEGYSPPLAPGTRLGPYVIVEPLGAGGMGAVFLGTDTRLRRKVALKCLTSRGTLPELHAKILYEARAAARINHPNVAAVYDVFEDEGRALLVMEYVEGESLAARLRRTRVTVAEAVAIARQLAAALTAAHARGVIHRDLKPANIQVMPDGTVKVLDFGVARARVALSTDTATTTGGTAVAPCGPQAGTPAYMAPEQLLGETADERSDIYSAGVVLYEMLAGRRPYAPTDATSLLAAFIDEPRPVDLVNPDVPAALSKVVARAIARDAHARFQTAAELGTALADVDGTRVRRGFDRRRRWAMAVAAVASVVAVAGIPRVVRHGGASPPHPPIIAVMPFVGDAGRSASSGLADVLNAGLATVPGIVLVPRDAAARVAPNASALPKATRELGLEYAVTGSVQRDGDGTAVVLNVVDAARGGIVASRAFASADATALPIVEEAAEWVIGQAEQLAHSSATRRPQPPTASVQAFEDYSQARQYLDRRDVAGNVDLAIAALQRAVSRDPGFALAHAALGDAYWYQYMTTRERGAADRAKDAALEALRLDPAQPMTRYALAQIYQGTGRRAEAIDELQKAIAIQPSNDELHRLLARVYGDTGQVDKAVTESLIAIRLRPGFWGSYRALGLVYYNAGRYPEAIATLTRLTELQPDSAPGFQLLGTVYHAAGDLDRALENYQRAIAIKPSPAALSNIGTIEYHRGRYAEAAAAYEKAIRLQPKEPVSYRNLGDALRRAGNLRAANLAYRQAVDRCDERLAVEKRDEKLTALKALCLAKLGRFAQARRAIDDALAMQPSGDVLYHLAIIETLDGRPDAALRALERALANGASAAYARDDDEFTPLRGRPEFQQILSSR